jgi:hypothetical protein
MSGWTATADGIIVYDNRAENPESDYDDPTLDKMDTEGVQEPGDFNADSDDFDYNPDEDYEYETNPTAPEKIHKRKFGDDTRCVLRNLLMRLQILSR